MEKDRLTAYLAAQLGLGERPALQTAAAQLRTSRRIASATAWLRLIACRRLPGRKARGGYAVTISGAASP